MALCHVIHSVGKEFGAIGEGFGPSDSEVLAMSQYYTEARNSLYRVASVEQRIVGGCGIGPLTGKSNVCELRKLFLLPESRGVGVGEMLARQCLEFARTKAFTACYLDTLSSMTSAISLYKKLGFEYLDAPLEGSVHNSCDIWMLKALA